MNFFFAYFVNTMAYFALKKFTAKSAKILQSAKRGLFLLVLFQVLFSSCSIEKKLATKFVKDPPAIDLQLFTPDILFKFNHKGEEIEGFDELTNLQQDSSLYAHSKFMQFVDDSIFMESYLNSFIDELRALGFKVFLDQSVDSFLQRQPQSYIVNISQIQMDEYTFPIEDTEPYGDSVLYQGFKLNGVDVSSWFEISKINASKPKKTVLYSSFTASDGFEGRYIMNAFTMDVQYKYKIDSLKMRDIYNLAVFSGKKNASYLFDYFMNQYVAFQLPDDGLQQTWYHYDRLNKSFIPTEEERFEVLAPK
jgi:hypothetical protein